MKKIMVILMSVFIMTMSVSAISTIETAGSGTMCRV